MTAKHIIYLDAFLEKRMGSPYNYIWNLLEGARQTGFAADIEFVGGNGFGDSRMKSDKVIKQTSLGQRDKAPVQSFWSRSDGIFTKIRKTFFDAEISRKIKEHVEFLEHVEAMDMPVGRLDTYLDTMRSLHVFTTVDALRAHNYLVRVHKRHRVKLILSLCTPGAPAFEWAQGYTNQGVFPFATKKLLQAHLEADAEAIRIADILMLPSKEAVEAYHQEIPDFTKLIRHKDVRLVPFGSDNLRPTVDKKTLRELFGFHDKFVATFVGYHAAIKGYDRVKRLGSKLLARHKNLAFLIGGVQRPLAGLDHPRWFECGFTREMDNLIEAGDVYITAQPQVFCDLIVVEALSQGKLVLAPRVGGNRAFENASAGLKLFSSDEELEESLQSFMQASEAEREAMAEANRKLYQQHYTSAIFAQNYQAMVGEIYNHYRLNETVPPVPVIEGEPQPEISVIIPVYNVEKYLDECLVSVLGQTFKNLEVIAVNDGSTDGSGDILARYAAQDKRLRVITTANRGMAAARNTGLDAARGNYIAHLDSDDLIDAKMYEILHQHCIDKNVKITTCAFSFYDGTTGKTYFHSTFASREKLLKYVSDGVTDLSNHRALASMFVAVWNALYHRSIFDHVRYHQNYDDLATSIEILAKQSRVGYVPKSLYCYRTENPGRIVRDSSNRIFDIFHIVEYIKSILGEVQGKTAMHETYNRLAIEVIRFRGTLASSLSQRVAFWGRANRFFVEEELGFEDLMKYRQPTTTERQLLELYRPYIFQRFFIRVGYAVEHALTRAIGFILKSVLEQKGDIVKELQNIQKLLEAQQANKNKEVD